jgi:hypothetical protein
VYPIAAERGKARRNFGLMLMMLNQRRARRGDRTRPPHEDRVGDVVEYRQMKALDDKRLSEFNNSAIIAHGFIACTYAL